jgi:hypothetical protein
MLRAITVLCIYIYKIHCWGVAKQRKIGSIPMTSQNMGTVTMGTASDIWNMGLKKRIDDEYPNINDI